MREIGVPESHVIVEVNKTFLFARLVRLPYEGNFVTFCAVYPNFQASSWLYKRRKGRKNGFEFRAGFLYVI